MKAKGAPALIAGLRSRHRKPVGSPQQLLLRGSCKASALQGHVTGPSFNGSDPSFYMLGY